MNQESMLPEEKFLTVELVRRICFGVREREHFLFPVSSNLLQYLVLSWDRQKGCFITSILDQHDETGERFTVLMRPLKKVQDLQAIFYGLTGEYLKISQ
jgi:hypothetical protein